MDKSTRFTGVNSIKFYRQFQDDAACLEYLASIKWPDGTYVCKKCGHTKYCKGKKSFSRRCIKCTATSMNLIQQTVRISDSLDYQIYTKRFSATSAFILQYGVRSPAW